VNQVSKLSCFLALVVVASCTDPSGEPSPRISTIPTQTSAGGSTFTFDVSSYVTTSADSSYAVTSGGGTFSTGQSVYSNTFDTLGTYTVQFTVRNNRDQVTASSFQVKVTSSEIVAFKSGDGVWLYDVNTGHIGSSAILSDDGRSKSYKAALSDGSLIYEVATSGGTDLWLYDPNVPELTVLGESSNDELYEAKTSTDIVLYRTGASTGYELYSYDKLREYTVGITSGIGTTNDTRGDDDPFVNSSDVVLFETQLNQGQKDVYKWDLSRGIAEAVANEATNEEVVATLSDGSFVISRLGSGGETDLYRWSVAHGLVEVGSDLDTSTPFTESKTYAGASSAGNVIFTTSDGSDTDIYVWLAATGQTLQIANTANNEAYCGVLSNGDVIYQTTASGNVTLTRYDLSDGSNDNFTNTGNATTAFHKVLTTDTVIFLSSTGNLYSWKDGVEAALTFSGSGEAFVAETSGGDFVVATDSGRDLELWGRVGRQRCHDRRCQLAGDQHLRWRHEHGQDSLCQQQRCLDSDLPADDLGWQLGHGYGIQSERKQHDGQHRRHQRRCRHHGDRELLGTTQPAPLGRGQWAGTEWLVRQTGRSGRTRSRIRFRPGARKRQPPRRERKGAGPTSVGPVFLCSLLVRSAGALSRAYLSPPSRSTTGQATQRSLLTSVSGGTSSAQLFSASGQRVRNGQPLGLRKGLGTSPSSLMRSGRSRCGSGSGTAESSARV
jgi:hypothetical protein